MNLDFDKSIYLQFLIDRNLILEAISTVEKIEQLEERAEYYNKLMNRPENNWAEKIIYEEEYALCFEDMDDESKNIFFYNEIFSEKNPEMNIDYEKAFQAIKDYREYQMVQKEGLQQKQLETGAKVGQRKDDSMLFDKKEIREKIHTNKEEFLLQEVEKRKQIAAEKGIPLEITSGDNIPYKPILVAGNEAVYLGSGDDILVMDISTKQFLDKEEGYGRYAELMDGVVNREKEFEFGEVYANWYSNMKQRGLREGLTDARLGTEQLTRADSMIQPKPRGRIK